MKCCIQFIEPATTSGPTEPMRSVSKHLQLLRPTTSSRCCSYSANSSHSHVSPHYAPPETESLLNHCYQRDLPRAMHVLDAMERRGVWADAISYSELIKCCLAHGAVRERKRVHRHIFSNGHHPKTFLTNSLINMSNSTSWKKRRYCSIKCLNEMSCHGLL